MYPEPVSSSSVKPVTTVPPKINGIAIRIRKPPKIAIAILPALQEDFLGLA
jgi:hypothetical protein